MAFFTPHGLKIRFDEESLENAIGSLKRSSDFNDLLMDIELWELLPVAMAKVAAIITAYLSGSWLLTLVLGIIAMIIGGIIRELTYSDILRRLFPLILGNGIVTIVVAIVCGFYLGSHNEYMTILILLSFFFPIAQLEAIITSMTLAPLIYYMGKHSIKVLGIPTTHVERAFIALCNKRASNLGLQIDWRRSLCISINS
jgi:branched-subunit amino acid transport protein